MLQCRKGYGISNKNHHQIAERFWTQRYSITELTKWQSWDTTRFKKPKHSLFIFYFKFVNNYRYCTVEKNTDNLTFLSFTPLGMYNCICLYFFYSLNISDI